MEDNEKELEEVGPVDDEYKPDVAKGENGEPGEEEKDEPWPHPRILRTEGALVDCGEAEEQLGGVAALGGDGVWMFEDGGSTFAGSVVPKAGRGYMRCECAIGSASGIGYPGLVIPSARIRTLLRASRSISYVRISRSGSTGAGDGLILWSEASWHEIRGVVRRAEVMAERYRTKETALEEWGKLDMEEMYDRVRLCEIILAQPQKGQEWGRVDFYKDGFMTVQSEQEFAKMPYDGELKTDVSLDIRVLLSALRMGGGEVVISGSTQGQKAKAVAEVISKYGILRLVEVGATDQHRADGMTEYDHGEETIVCKGSVEHGTLVAQGARMLNATIPRRNIVEVEVSEEKGRLALSCSHREKGMRAGSSYGLEDAVGEGKLNINVVKLGAVARTMSGPTTITMYARDEKPAYLVLESGSEHCGVLFGGMRMRQDMHVQQLSLA